MKLDYDVQTLEERKKIVDQILQENPNPSPAYLEILADYLVFCMNKDERKEKTIMTKNRMATVNKREMSYEGLVSKFENGEDGVHNLLSNEKHLIFRHNIKITDKDREEIPALSQATQAIEYWTNVLKTAEGKDKFIAKSALIDARKEQYSIRSSQRPVVGRGQKTSQNPKEEYSPKLDGYITFDEEGYCVPHGVTLVDPKICSTILCNYLQFRKTDHNSDLWSIMNEFDDVAKRALEPLPMYKLLVECKIKGYHSEEVQDALYRNFGIKHSLEYISSLWRRKIPAIIASKAEDDYLDWYYTVKEKGQWKRCSRCGKVKLAHNKYFSKNSTSKDGFYSICKECRNTKEE